MRRFFASVLTVCALAVCGCEPPVYPGDSLGTFDVVGALEENTCGSAAVPALDPLTFSVELRRQGALAYWRMTKQPLTTGVVMSSGALRFRTETWIPVLADEPALGYPGCALVQTEEVEVTVDGVETETDAGAGTDGGVVAGDASVRATDGGVVEDVEPRTLAGDNVITFAPDPASDCTPLLASLGGPWLALPCAVRYELTGTAEPPTGE
jgi:hypothetical protein